MRPGRDYTYTYSCRYSKPATFPFPLMPTASLRVVGHECHTPCNNKKFYIYSDGTHTCTPCRSRWMKWTWKWDGNDHDMTNYLTGTRDGERKRRREKGRTPTPTHLAQNGQTQKEQGEEKADGTMGQTPTRGVGGGRKRLTQPTRREPNLPRHAEGPKPDLTRVHKRCIINQCKDSCSGSKALQFQVKTFWTA